MTGRLTACWRYDDGDGGDDRFHCGEELATTGTYDLEEVAPHGTAPGDQDHVGYDLDGAARILANHSVEGATSNLRVRLLDDAADPQVLLSSTAGSDHPDVAVSSLGVYHVVWQENDAGTNNRIQLQRRRQLDGSPGGGGQAASVPADHHGRQSPVRRLHGRRGDRRARSSFGSATPPGAARGRSTRR